jgi:glycosyltransferase involved in cell wall biosynthesis
MPNISIILPIRNEYQNIRDTIDNILSQNYDLSKIEIIVIDGKSTDSTKNILMSYGDKIKVLDNPQKYMPAGFNIGLSESNGSIIIMMGGHCILDKDYVKNCVNKLLNNEYACVGGIIQNKSTNIKQEAISLALSSYFGVGGVDFRMKNTTGKLVDTIAFGAYKRNVFNKIGSLDEELVKNQDDEFNYRLIQSGLQIWMDPIIKSLYKPRGSLIKLFKQYFSYGFYKLRLIQKRKGIPSWRHLIPCLFFSLLLCCLILSFTTQSFIPFIIGIAPYIFINIIFSIWVGRKNINTIYLLPFIFFILHFSYGFGFTIGFFYFISKWGDTKIINDYFDFKKFNSVKAL